MRWSRFGVTYDELYTLLNRIAQGNTEWHSDSRSATKKVAGELEVDHFTTLSAQLAALQNQISNIMFGVTQPTAAVMEFNRLQIGQIAAAQNTRPQGGLPSDTKNSKQVITINLRSGKEMNEEPPKKTNEADAELIPPQEIPKYAKYLKDVVTSKVKLQDVETVGLTEECNSMVMQKMPKNLKDLGKFTLLIQIGNSEVVHTLSDLGVSINLMPFSLFNTLSLGKSRPSFVLLQLENRTIARPEGVIEDVLIKDDKFIIPADFIILDFQADKKVPVILKRPFLATGGALINVREGMLTMRLDDEEAIFKVYKPLNTLYHYKDLCMIIMIEEDKCRVVILFHKRPF
ncbi:uncharacterized protein LOC107858083 [Capsicum annuum]|uniref:uncharacterized protein LOC107858083 n=1 Tax=Capsicum annuum TaxID=4072 RepID=UPI001FB1566B|nr:uncharacterized protein LOC107858083 [Capsicum annuum]